MEEWTVKGPNKFNTSPSIFKGFTSQRDSVDKGFYLSIKSIDDALLEWRNNDEEERWPDIWQLYLFLYKERLINLTIYII